MNNSVVMKYLSSKGYCVNTLYYKNISSWNQWYVNKVNDFHTYHDHNGDKKELYKLGMAKKGCEDWSSILYTERDSMICDNQNNQNYLDKQLFNIGFDDMIPENIENAFWSGTVVTVTRLKNVILKDNELTADDKTKIDVINVTAESIVPLKTQHGKIQDLAIISETTIENKKAYYIEIHELTNNEYVIKNSYVNESGEEIDLPPNLIGELHTHSKIPQFSVLSPRIVNNVENNNGLGISIYANAIDQLKGCDLAYNNYLKDTELGGKKVFYNKKLVKYFTVYEDDKDGNKIPVDIPIYPDDITKQQFQVLGDDMENVNDKTLIQEYNPNLRMEDNEKNVNLALNLFSFKIGLGKGFYKFENGTVVTATQYLGENKDLVDNAKKHRKALNEYCVGIARAILVLGRLVFHENVDENDKISLTDKDGFLVSEEELQEQYRQDFQAGLMSKLTYLMKARGMSKQQALDEIALINESNPKIEEVIG